MGKVLSDFFSPSLCEGEGACGAVIGSYYKKVLTLRGELEGLEKCERGLLTSNDTDITFVFTATAWTFLGGNRGAVIDGNKQRGRCS